jgi:hypothetical protein
MADEFVQSVEEIAADPRFDDLRFIVNDFLEVEDHDIDGRVLERIAITRLGSLSTNPNIRVLLITSDVRMAKLATGISTEPYGKTYETVVFATMAEAREWVELQLPLLKPTKRGRF